MQKKRIVLVFRTQLLPKSEVFIKNQILSYHKWDYLLVGESYVKKGLSLDALNHSLLPFGSLCLFRPVVSLLRRLGVLDSFDVSFIRNVMPDVFHIHFAVDAVRISSVLSRIQCPIFITLHGYDINIYKSWWENGNAGFFMRNYPKKLLSLAKHENVRFIAVSNAIKRQAVSYGIPESKIDVSYIGIDVNDFSPGIIPLSVRNKILFIGRLVEKKGCIHLLNAFKILLNKQLSTNAELEIIGDGPQRSFLEMHAKTIGVKVKFSGVCSQQEIKNILSETRVLCLPSIVADNGDAEGLGLVILEAQASGVPVITSARGGATEGIIHGVTGFAHEEGDERKLAEYLELIFDVDFPVDEMSDAARKFVVNNMCLNICTDKLEKLYDKTLP